MGFLPRPIPSLGERTRNMRRFIVGFFLGLTLIASAQEKPKTVLVSFLPLLESAERIAGNRLEVKTLLPVGASPHTFDPTPKDVLTVRNADVLLASGYGIDVWFERLWRVGGQQARLVKLAEKAEFPRIGVPRRIDAHVWLDASVMASMAREIGLTYALFDPPNAGLYRQAAELEQQRLLALHQEIKWSLEPIKGAGLVVFHNAWNYFVRAYGLRIAATVRLQADRDPSAKEIAEIVRLMRREQIKAIFVEPQLPDRVARVIALEVGASVFVLDPEGSSLAKDYTGLMRYNAATLLKALR
jgi:ABC-type Zn uptake system ZnuABC Zn-binding protein ZnuA